MLKKLLRAILPNPLDRLLRKAKKQGKQQFLIVWNRGLGDLPLGLYALNLRIKQFIPEGKITYLTREDLSSGFAMLPCCESIIDPEMKRGSPINVEEALSRLQINQHDFDIVIEKPNPTYWVKWQIGKVIPKLHYPNHWDEQAKKFNLKGTSYIGVHVDTETGQYYGYEKNWPKQYWQELFERLDRKIILFGTSKCNTYDFPHVIDLRGETTVPEMLSIIKNHCSDLIVPDSGVLSLVYYLDVDFQLHIYSLWADSNQGILKQKVPSPNPSLMHFPFISKKDTSQITPNQLLRYF